MTADLKRIWDNLSKPTELKDRQLSDYFDLAFTALPHKILSAWKVNVLTLQTAMAVYFEVVTPAGQPLQQDSRGLIHFINIHLDSNNCASQPLLATLPKLVLHMLQHLSTKKLR